MSQTAGPGPARQPLWVDRAVRGVSILGVWLLLPAAITAHRLDEYLQATRVAVDRSRVDLEIDLTPGIAVAHQVFDWIDADRNGQISAAEGDAYARLVLGSIALDVDEGRQTLRLVDRQFPTLHEMSLGVGTIRLTATTLVPPASAGRHRLVYRNAHRPEMSVYLVNALVPKNTDIQIAGQQRDWQQHELRLDYRVAWPVWPSALSWQLIASAGLASGLTVVTWRHARSRT